MSLLSLRWHFQQPWSPAGVSEFLGWVRSRLSSLVFSHWFFLAYLIYRNESLQPVQFSQPLEMISVSWGYCCVPKGSMCLGQILKDFTAGDDLDTLPFHRCKRSISKASSLNLDSSGPQRACWLSGLLPYRLVCFLTPVFYIPFFWRWEMEKKKNQIFLPQ